MAFDNYGPFPPPQTTMAPDPEGNVLSSPRMDQFKLNPTQSGSTPIRTLGMPNTMDDQLAHFQSLTNRLISPYNIVGQNSWLAQNHPQVAGILDRVGTVAALTPGPRGPEGVGGGISRAFEGLMGANQLDRQKAMQAATLPYQLMMPQLQARNLQSEIDYRQSEIPWRQSGVEYNKARVQHYEDMQEQGKVGTPQIDKQGGMWVTRTTTKGVELFNAVTGQKADPDNPPEFVGKLDRASQEYGGGVQGRIIAMQQSDDPATQEKGRQAAGILTGMMGAGAGARTGGEQNAPHPQAQAQELEQSARATIGKNITPVRGKNPNDYLIQGIASTAKEANDMYIQDRKTYQDSYEKQQQWVDSYISSGSAKKGTSFTNYIAQQKQRGINANPNTAPSPSTSTSGNTGSNWTPRQ